MSLTRIVNFDNLNCRVGTVVDSEFNNLINVLSGITQNNIIINYDDDSAPVLEVSQLSKGKSIDFQKSNVSKVSVNNGSLTSYLATGLAPFVIVSTTVCPGLNVGFLDDIDTVKFNSNSLYYQFFTGELQITKLSTGTQSIKAVYDSDKFDLKRTSDNQVLFTIDNIESDEDIILSLPSTNNLQLGYEPNVSYTQYGDLEPITDILDYFDVLRLKDITKNTVKKQIISFCRSGNLSTNDIIGVYIAPCPINNIVKLCIAHIELISGAVAQTIKFYKNNVEIATAHLSNTLLTLVSIPFNLDLVENDTIMIKVTTASPGTISLVVQLLLTW